MAHSLPAAAGEPDAFQVRAELDRILASELFLRSGRLSAFLRFIVDETLKGGGATLKEHVIAVEVYGKDADFNTAADPIVRVDARRLRDKLREFYASAPPSPVVISVPKGSYTPVFEPGDPVRRRPPLVARVRVASTRESAETPGRIGWRRVVIAGLVLALIAASAWLVVSLRGGRAFTSAQRLLTVTSFPGAEDDPTLSPDGNFVAFSWSSPDDRPNDDLLHDDIWVAAVEVGGLRRLTTSDANDKWPQWSPDGRAIAYTRLVRGKPSVYLISPLGGPERMVADGAMMPGWTPDSRALVMVSGPPDVLQHLSLDTGARRKLVAPPPGFIDLMPRISPDGGMMAFVRSGPGRSAIFVVPLSGGEPRLVGSWMGGPIGGITWTPDSREIIYARPETSGRRLVRTTLDASQPTPVSGVSFGTTGPTVQRAPPGMPYRLAFVAGQVDVGLRLIDLTPAAPGQPFGDTAFADATRMDAPGRFSPDGTEVAFTSDRGGSQQVWVAGRDGSAIRSVTRLEGATVNVWSWSPDGQWVAFDATIGGDTDLYAVRKDGGGLKRLTEGPAIEVEPEWSRDGAWIYFSSNASGTRAIWKMPANGGSPVQVSTEPGFEPRVSPDGRTVYFVNMQKMFARHRAATLKQVSSGGGLASVVLTDVTPGGWDLTDTGIVFLPSRAGPMSSAGPEVIMRHDFADGQTRQLGTTRFGVSTAFTTRFLIVSRDGRWAVASHIDRFDRDIMVLENFR